MKLTLRTVSGGTTVFEVTEEETVGSLKAKMADDYDLPSLKLCHKGKVLDDAKTFKDLGFGDAETLIIAGKKKALVAKAPETAPAPAPTPAPAPVQAPPVATSSAPTETAPAPASTTEPSAPASTTATTDSAPAQSGTAPAPPAPAPAAPAADVGPPVDEDAVAFIMGMGFEDKAAVVHALRCAFGNADRAVEYMFSGIPAGVEAQIAAQNRAPPARSPSVQQQQGGGGAPGAPAPGGAPGGEMTAEQLGAMMQQMQQQEQGGGSELENALRALPQFDQVRALIRQNPAALPVVMQQLQQHSPELFALVQANPQEFLDIMQRGGGGGGGGAPGGGGEEGGDGGQVSMQLTPADAEPIQRLVALGGGVWDVRAATIVYLACRRHEEHAANVLLENGGLPAELADVEFQEGGAPGAE